MIKVQILAQCEHCQGQAYLPIGEGEDYRGRKYTRYAPCTTCERAAETRQVGQTNRLKYDYIKRMKRRKNPSNHAHRSNIDQGYHHRRSFRTIYLTTI